MGEEGEGLNLRFGKGGVAVGSSTYVQQVRLGSVADLSDVSLSGLLSARNRHPPA